MITNFNLDVLSTYRNFFLLNQMPKNMENVVAVIQTPEGLEEVDFIDFFLMSDGTALAAWRHPLQKLGLHAVMAMSGDDYQIINMTCIERVYEIYNRPLNSENGVFIFTDSHNFGTGDWRCDRGYYGPHRFVEDIPDRVFNNDFNILYYESVLSVPRYGHIVYLETTDKTSLGSYLVDNAVVPAWTRTIQELLRLIYEWSLVASAPFNNTDRISECATGFIEHMKFTISEIEALNDLPQMQVFNYLSGSENARVRPSAVVELSEALSTMLFSRLSSSSVSFILSQNPACGDITSVLEREIEELSNGFSSFRDYYGVPDHYTYGIDNDVIMECVEIIRPKELAYAKNQLRHFTNKQAILNSLAL